MKKLSLNLRRRIKREIKNYFGVQAFTSKKKRTTTKLAIKLNTFQAYFCPGSCIFLFWIYRVGTKAVFKPDLYLYTGDCSMTKLVKENLIRLRNREDVETVTIVNDNTRTDNRDNGFSKYKHAIKAMVDFIEDHKKHCNSSITVKISADWGMDTLCKSLARRYNADLHFCDDIESVLRYIKSKHFFCTIKNTSKKEDGKNQDSNRKVMYVIKCGI